MVSSARNPNESYAQRAKKAGTSRTTQRKQQPASHALSPHPLAVDPSLASVWEQAAHADTQPAHMPRQRATSSPQPPPDEPIPPTSPPQDLSAKLAILDRQDEHDPFVVRVPPHLSRQSSSSTNPVPATDPNAWPHLPGADPPSNASSAGHDSPFLSAAPSRQNSTASVRHHAHSPSDSVRLSRTQRQAFSQHSHSASQSRTQSRSGSSASSPRLLIHGRTLLQDDPLPPDLTLDHQHRPSSNKRPSPALSDSNHISSASQTDSVTPPADTPYYRPPPGPPLQDMPPRYTHNFVLPYALPPQFPHAQVPGHASPPYIPPHSSQGTPPYPHYPPYPAYMYGHLPSFWSDIPHPHPHSQVHPPNQPTIPSNHDSASEPAVTHKIEFGSMSLAITTEFGASMHPAPGQNGLQPKPSKSVVFGTINLAESQDGLPNKGQRTDAAVEYPIERFATFSIGVSPDEPGPPRLASRKSSSRSLSRTFSSQPSINDANIMPPSSQKVNGIKKPTKWEFGTTLSEVLDDPRLPLNHKNESGAENAEDQPDPVNVSPSHDTSQAVRSMDKSETGSPASDVWVVKDYGYGFGNYSGCGNAPDVVRWEMREREKERLREVHRDRDQYRDRVWELPRQPGWWHDNGVEEGSEGWEQQAQIDAPRHMRPRRGSFPGYGGHERGGFPGRRGRGLGGRFHGRGRGGFYHHQRLGSYPYQPLPLPLPFEALPPAIDMVNGYGQPPYAPPELESYEAVPPAPRLPFTSATYSVDAMQDRLLGQLEYYLSPQNMAQDFYLRQRMDNEGWIPISLLASFKRVQQLHTDASIVREVLSRSAMVEVSGDWVRMRRRQWEPFVLPSAPRSVVTRVDHDEDTSPGPGPYHDSDVYAGPGDTEGIECDYDGEDCEGDDEDDDIEFVIGQEAEGSWMPVPERKH